MTRELDPRRRFSRSEVRRAWQRQGRKCNLCDRSIPMDLMHGDHIEPHIFGGRTEYVNLQALCGSCNLRKGTQPQEVAASFFDADRLEAGTPSLRLWQQEAMAVVMPLILSEPMLVGACPGAGKTHFGLEVAYRLLSAGDISRVLIVVPSLGIADGWARSASKTDRFAPTLPLRSPRNWKPVNPIGDKWVGAIATYQSVGLASDMYLAHVTDPGHRTMVIFDEVHHAGVENSWGSAAQEAFARYSKAVLSLTGTPFRTDRSPIVFVPSVGGSADPHYTYDYGTAIKDGACRPVQFVFGRGETEFRDEAGTYHSVTFDDKLTEQGERRRVRAALEFVADGSIAHTLLSAANDYLIDLRRRGDNDAAGLVVCVDCDHADAVATFMRQTVIGTRPVVACSRLHNPVDPAPANAIAGFRKGHDPWLVAVNMVSEGIDIRRLRVVVYLTNRLTMLSFRQIVGRVVRTDPENVDDQGRVYMPADPALVAMATAITEEAELLPPPIVIERDRTPRPIKVLNDDPHDVQPNGFEVLGTTGDLGSAADTHGRRASAHLVARAAEYIERRGLKGTDAVSLALAASENAALKAALLEFKPDD